jgi:endonuclease I
MSKRLNYLILTVIVCVFSLPLRAVEPPDNQPTSFATFTVKPWRATMAYWPSAGGADGYLVIRNTNGITPVFSRSLLQGEMFDGNKVIYRNVGSMLIDTEVVAGETYYYFVYAYNLLGDSCVLALGEPLKGTIKIPETIQDAVKYFDGISPEKPGFLTQLQSRLINHRMLNYSSFGFDIANYIYLRDTTMGKKYIVCHYSNDTTIFTPLFSFQDLDFSREHVMPRSWMPTGGSTDQMDGADYHNLLLIRHNEVNSVRSNYPFDSVHTLISSFKSGKLGRNKAGNMVYEVQNSAKGDVARCIFYMMTAYNSSGGKNWGLDNLPSLGPQQDMEVLLKWHQQDPPDAEERSRHAMVAESQDNRNPFIDFPYWACYIDFRKMQMRTVPDAECVAQLAYLNNPASVDISQHIVWYPNPSTSGVFQLQTQFTHFAEDDLHIEVYDLKGQKQAYTWDKQSQTLQLKGVSSGLYKIKLRMGMHYATASLAVE